jgi:hypothetical protein
MATTTSSTPHHYVITLNNKEIWQFYHDHPEIDPEEANLLFIDFVDTMFQKRVPPPQRDLGATLTALTDSVTQLHAGLVQHRRDYVEDVKQIVGNQTLTVADKLSAVADRNTQVLSDKTALLLNDALPKQLRVLQEALQQKDTKVLDELADFLGKFKNNSSTKGKLGELQLGQLLTALYPSAEVQVTGSIKASGDFVLRRVDRAPILFENKDYDYNVPKEEVAKFIRDVDTQGMSGVFISHHAGIAHKQNFQIDLNQGHVLVYVQHCNYDADKVRVAVDIVDHFLHKLGDLIATNDEDGEAAAGGGGGGGGVEIISKEVLDSINVEYQKFVVQRETLVTTVKDFQKKMTAQIDELQLPSLDKYLEPKFAAVRSAAKNLTCDFCNAYCAPSKQSLSAHKRGCKAKMVSSTPPPATGK